MRYFALERQVYGMKKLLKIIILTAVLAAIFLCSACEVHAMSVEGARPYTFEISYPQDSNEANVKSYWTLEFDAAAGQTTDKYTLPCPVADLKGWSTIKVYCMDSDGQERELKCKPDGKSAVYEIYMDNPEGVSTLYTVKLIKSEHHYELDFFLEPYCDRKGYDEYYCSKCQNRYKVEKEKLPHKWFKKPTITKEPTIYNFGKQAIRCQNCNTIKPGSIKQVAKKKPLGPITLGSAITPELSKVSGYDDLRFTWAKDRKAKGYQVEYRVKGTKKWMKYNKGKWVSKTRIYLKNMKDGVRYQLRVRACYKSGNKVGYSKWSYDMSCMTLAKVNITSIKKQSGNYITVKWKRIPTEGEDGYIVYRSASKNGKYKKVAEVYQKAKAYPTAKVYAKKGKTYYYRVKAFSRWDGEHYIYGPWSNTIKFKR